MIRRIFALLLSAVLLVTGIPAAGAANNWNMEYFLKKYSDPRFDLNNEPARVMTVEEFLGLVYAYSYYGDGAKPVTARDKNGKLPASWCAPYVQAEVNKGVVTSADVSWTQPVTLAFAAQYLARAKGKYSYDAVNLYSFTGTGGLGADDVLYLCTAVDCGLLPYTPGMDVSRPIVRRDLRKYEVPAGQVTVRAAIAGSGNTMRENHVYFTDCYWDLDKAQYQFDLLQQNAKNITMVTFQSGYLNGQNVSQGNRFLGCDLEHTETLKYSTAYRTDPQVEAAQWCRSNGKLTFLGVSNAASNAFTGEAVQQILLQEESMDTAVSEIVSAVRRFDLSGVNLGIELPEQYGALRTAYGRFAEKLSAALHREGRLLMISVGAYFTEAQEAKSFYEYAALNRAADYIHVILYDDYNDTGYPWRKTDGAVSNLTRIGRCLRYAAVRMDAGKLLLGTGSFAVDFNKTALTAQDIDHGTALELQQRTGAQLKWDSASAGAYFDYTQSGSTHRVWLETPGSLDARGKLLQQYGLCGFSTYNLAFGTEKLLAAQTKSSAFYPEVQSAMACRLIPRSLRKDYGKAITREEFCHMISEFICAFSGRNAAEAALQAGKTPGVFTDTQDQIVCSISALGIVTGYTDGTFRPARTITRQEAAVMLMRLAKFCGMETPNGEAVSFTELASMPSWAREGVAFTSACTDAVSGKRVMGGTGAGKFSPAASYTREQSAMTMIRLLHALQGVNKL